MMLQMSNQIRSCLIRLILKNNYNVKYNISSDTDLILKLLYKTQAVNTFFITHMMESGGISSQYINLYNGKFFII